MQHAEHLEQPISRDVSVARRLLSRDDLLQVLDRAVSKRVTIVSAPPGSGKTSLLRAWAARSANLRRVASVSVDRDEEDAQRFWAAVLDAIRRSTRSTDPRTQHAAATAVDADQLVDAVVSELAEQVGPVVLIIDDLHELKSADALAQLERLLAVLPTMSFCVAIGHQLCPSSPLKEGEPDVKLNRQSLRCDEREAMLIYSMGVSVDGFIADREGGFGWTVPNEEQFRFHLAQVRELGSYLCGRKLYETMLPWETDPSMRDNELRAAFAESGALSEGRLRRGSRRSGQRSARRASVAEIRPGARRTDKDVSIGGAGLAAAAIELGLVDELRMFRNPVVVGGGTPFLPPVTEDFRLDLVETRTFGSRVMYERTGGSR